MADLAKHMMYLGERGEYFVRLLQQFLCLGDRYSGERCGHIQYVALIERRHELAAQFGIGVVGSA